MIYVSIFVYACVWVIGLTQLACYIYMYMMHTLPAQCVRRCIVYIYFIYIHTCVCVYIYKYLYI